MNHFKTVLAVDTALNACSAGLYSGAKIMTDTTPMAQGHGEHLMGAIERVLGKAETGFRDLEAIVTTIGPGAFTGLRIGISAAKGLATALEIPLYGIATTQALASGYAARQSVKNNIAVVIETKRHDFYIQLFDKDAVALNEAMALPAEEIPDFIDGKSFVVIGDAIDRFKNAMTSKWLSLDYDQSYAFPDTGFIASLLATSQASGEFFSEGAEPLYLRGADVTQSKKIFRTIEAKNW